MRGDWPTPFLDRFWSKAVRDNATGCLIWTGATDDDGYGLVYMRVTLPWPKGQEARHSCDTPPCIEPTHVRPGTRQENVHDALDRGRHANAYGLTHRRST